MDVFKGLMLLAAIPTSAAASQQTGTRQQVVVASPSPPPVFLVSGSRSAKPACATDDYWAVPSSTDYSNHQLTALVITAYATGRTVLVQGTGTCNALQPNRKDVGFIIAQ